MESDLPSLITLHISTAQCLVELSLHLLPVRALQNRNLAQGGEPLPQRIGT